MSVPENILDRRTSDIQREFLMDACMGDGNALEVAIALGNLASIIDDAADGDQNTPAVLANVVARAVAAFGINPFWQANSVSLVPLMAVACSAWAESNDLQAHDDSRIQVAGDVLKSFYREVVHAIAFLIGGYDHMHRIATQYRTFDFEKETY